MKIKFCSFFVFLFFLFTGPVWAVHPMESDNFKIDWPNLNMGAGLPSSGNYGLGVTTGQTAPGLYESFETIGFKVRAGFQYIHSLIPFTFTIDKIAVDFGALTVGVGTTDTIGLEVDCGSAGGYAITAHENKPLTSSTASTIADTTCDTGDTCDESDAGTWTLSTTYGFGYGMSGTDVPGEFSGGKYKQYADLSLPTPETPQAVMTGSNAGRNKQATMTLKVNVSGLQAAGVYENIIIFIATPTY